MQNIEINYNQLPRQRQRHCCQQDHLRRAFALATQSLDVGRCRADRRNVTDFLWSENSVVGGVPNMTIASTLNYANQVPCRAGQRSRDASSVTLQNKKTAPHCGKKLKLCESRWSEVNKNDLCPSVRAASGRSAPANPGGIRDEQRRERKCQSCQDVDAPALARGPFRPAFGAHAVTLGWN